MSKQRPMIPAEFAGKWIAWDQRMTMIAAHAATLDEVAAMAPNGVYQRVPPLGCRPLDVLPPELRKAFEASWKRNEAAYRYLAARGD